MARDLRFSVHSCPAWTLAVAAALVLAVSVPSAFALTAECTGNPVLISNGPTCGVCPDPADVVSSDGTCVALSSFCDVYPGDPATVTFACTLDGEQASLTCTVEALDVAPPGLECSAIQLGCTDTHLGTPPMGSAPCGQPTTTECFVCTDPGGTCEPGAPGLIPWDDYVPSGSDPVPYLCAATIVGRESEPGLPPAQNTNWCTNFIQPAAEEFNLIIVPREPDPLWPPDHELKTYSLPDSCISELMLVNGCTGESTPVNIQSAGIQITHITSNEPDDGQGPVQTEAGDGDTSCDMKILDGDHLMLRNERAGRGSGRVYNVYYRVFALDPSGSSTDGSGVCKFEILHSKNQPATSTSSCLSCTGEGCGTIPSCEPLPPVCGE